MFLIHFVTPIPGHITHRTTASACLKLRGLDVEPKRVLITQGMHEGLLIYLSSIIQSGDTVLCEHLNYTSLRRIGQLLGISLIGVKMIQEGMCPIELNKSINTYSPKAIICTPVNHNPTTITYSKENILEIGKMADEASIPII